MSTSRRQFLSGSLVGLAGATLGTSSAEAADGGSIPPPGAPPAFGTSPATGPEVTPATFAEAEKLVQVSLSQKERAQAASSWRQSMAAVYERRTGPRTLPLEPELSPATVWNPVLPGQTTGPARSRFVPSKGATPPLPSSEDELAHAPVTALSAWIASRQLSSERLTRLYLDRIDRLDPKLRAVITVTRELALSQARRADAELAKGHRRGPLHGIPWGAKDLVDTAGIRTTWGAEPFRDRIPTRDAVVVDRLHRAGAVLIAKLSLGALALNDVWFGGQTQNPWLLEEGASGSSAGPGAATAAGLVGFALGSETGGSIISPSMRCGVTGLRPTFGRVPRTGAMTLCWSLDKLGPMARGVEDTLLVLAAISGPDAGDVSSVSSRLDFDASAPVQGLRVGVVPNWMEESPATEVDRAALAMLEQLGLKRVEVALPDWPYSSLNLILFSEAAASFEELTLGHGVDALAMQVPDAWPNHTGHPSLTLRTGFVEVAQARSDWAPDPAHPLPTFSPPRRVPHGVTLIGRLFEEGTLGRVGMALERAANVSHQRPPGF